MLLQGDLESGTSSSQEVAVVVPEIVEVLKPIEEVEQVVRMESLMDPLAKRLRQKLMSFGVGKNYFLLYKLCWQSIAISIDKE